MEHRLAQCAGVTEPIGCLVGVSAPAVATELGVLATGGSDIAAASGGAWLSVGVAAASVSVRLDGDDVVEELAHFRQAQRDGYWGTSKQIPRE